MLYFISKRERIRQQATTEPKRRVTFFPRVMAPTSAAVSMTTRAVICGLLLCGFIRFAAASPSPLRFNGNGNTDLQKLYEKISSLQVQFVLDRLIN